MLPDGLFPVGGGMRKGWRMSWDFGGSPSGAGSSGSWDSAPKPAQSPSESPDSGGSPDPLISPPSRGSQVSAAPIVWLAAPAVVALIAIVAQSLTRNHWVAVGAWVLAGPVAIALLAVFVRRDTERRADPWYAESALVDWARRLVVVLALLGVALSAYTIADAVARSNW